MTESADHEKLDQGILDEIPLVREGKPTAWAIFQDRSHRDLEYNWSAFCTAIGYCTSPCSECGGEARKHRESQSR
jgi:hypothetical protein